jgi:plasmid stabilization system protein ParE
VKVELSKRAQRSIERIDARWRGDADFPETFRDELDALIEHLQTVRAAGTPYATPKQPELRRMLLEKTRVHVYFVINASEERIEVLQVWDGRRERPPQL